MQRRSFLAMTASTALLSEEQRSNAQTVAPVSPREILPGVWRYTFGDPERITPLKTHRYPADSAALEAMPALASCPVRVSGQAARGGYRLSVPLQPRELVYGLGLMLQSFMQRGLKKQLRVNADPVLDSGDSHAPVPFYVTTGGYGVYIDTARYVTVYCGNKRERSNRVERDDRDGGNDAWNGLPGAYTRYHLGESSEVLIEIPRAAGVDVYIFGGPAMRDAVRRYNLFAGGGALPPRWGLGIWYRAKTDYSQADVLKLAAEFRQRSIPCDVIGVEPGWQSHRYSCSYVWDRSFPKPAEMVRTLAEANYRVNLWEHAFVHPSSPIHESLAPHSGNYEVWGGLVPDFLTREGKQIFAGFHGTNHISLGVAGYKLDECDNSDYTGNWSFPEFSAFPSGADGEQMHCLFGLRYQDALQDAFEQAGKRTYGLCRSSGALAAPSPYVLYSDLYDHRQFVRGMVNMGFSGLLWTPELRHAASTEDLIRRLQSTVLSPLALINAWYITMPPWKQVDRQANNQGKLAPDWEEIESHCRAVMQLRMQLIPYLHAAFVRYRREGLPPFRALVLDYPDDPDTYSVDDQYLMGESLLAAPMFAGQSSRSVYLPGGEWYDFWTARRHSGKQRIQVQPPLSEIPLFVRAGTLLPLAKPTLHVDDPDSRKLMVHAYGNGPAQTTLFEDGSSLRPELVETILSWEGTKNTGTVKRSGRPAEGLTYEVLNWKRFA
jgi:alpha-D-xyloside xylohydrolase